VRALQAVERGQQRRHHARGHVAARAGACAAHARLGCRCDFMHDCASSRPRCKAGAHSQLPSENTASCADGALQCGRDTTKKGSQPDWYVSAAQRTASCRDDAPAPGPPAPPASPREGASASSSSMNTTAGAAARAAANTPCSATRAHQSAGRRMLDGPRCRVRPRLRGRQPQASGAMGAAEGL